MIAIAPIASQPAPGADFQGGGHGDSPLHLAQLEARARRELGRAAARFLAVGGHHPLGFSRIGDYSQERLGISGRELQSFAFVASKLDRLPLVARAFARGEISWSQARLLCAAARVVDLRLYRALGFQSFESYTHEQLGVSPAKARALVMVERRSHHSPELASAYRSGALSWVRALCLLPVVEDAAHARSWVARAQEVTVRRLQDEVEWALEMRDAHERPVAPPETGIELSRPDLQTCARLQSEIADRKVTFFGPASVVGLFRAGMISFTLPGEPQWKGFERLLQHAVGEWAAQPRHRDPIFERDGWRCSVPACSGRRSLHDHHITYRSRGGGNERWNRVAVCASHHLHAVHLNVVGASGRAPFDVVWQLGLRPGRVPLLRLHGERYLSAL